MIDYFKDKLKKIYYKYLITDEKLINKRFNKRLGRNVNLKNPSKYNDKIQWLKLYWRNSLATQCADKYEVREYVRRTIGGNYLNNLLGVYNSVFEIRLDKLPKSFVLKGTHGSGFNIICKDKNQIDWTNEFKKMKRWLWNNYYWPKREWVYKDIKPRIIAESYLSDDDGHPPMDYKIFCFHGEPKFIQVDIDRFGDHKSNLYDINWNLLDFRIENSSDKSVKVKEPENLHEMLEVSRKLSYPFPHVRVDLYNINNNVIFGELTFYHHSGFGKFDPPESESEIGKLLTLPEKVNT